MLQSLTADPDGVFYQGHHGGMWGTYVAMAQVAGRTPLCSLTAVNCTPCLELTNKLYQCENASCHARWREKAFCRSPSRLSLIFHDNSAAADQHRHTQHPHPTLPTSPCCFSGKQCPMMDGWAFGLRRRSVTVTIIHTLEDWRVIELCPVMEFLHLRIWKLKFAFAYCKWCSIYIWNVCVSAFQPCFISLVHVQSPQVLNW